MVAGLDPISVCVDNDRVFVNVRLSDDISSGTQAEIVHDHFIIEPAGWDWNFDEKAFEAVDDAKQPVLQLSYRSPSDILVRGVFVSRGVTALVTERGTTTIPASDLPLFRAKSDLQIKRIFKYPQDKYLHVRE